MESVSQSTAMSENSAMAKPNRLIRLLSQRDRNVPDASPVSDDSDYSKDSGDISSSYVTSLSTSNENVPGEVGGETFRVSDDEDGKEEKHVQFSKIEIRSYPIILGDHPEAFLGPPLTIGWDSFDSSVVSLDKYESERETRKSSDDLRLGRVERKRILKENDCANDEELRKAAYEAHLARKRRAATVGNLPMEFIQVPLESLQRKLRRALSIGRTKEQ